MEQDSHLGEVTHICCIRGSLRYQEVQAWNLECRSLQGSYCLAIPGETLRQTWSTKIVLCSQICTHLIHVKAKGTTISTMLKTAFQPQSERAVYHCFLGISRNTEHRFSYSLRTSISSPVYLCDVEERTDFTRGTVLSETSASSCISMAHFSTLINGDVQNLLR